MATLMGPKGLYNQSIAIGARIKDYIGNTIQIGFPPEKKHKCSTPVDGQLQL